MSDDGRVRPEDRMTSRERLVASYRGEQVDRLPYWPKVFNANWRNGQPERIASLDDTALMDLLGADGLFRGSACVRITRPRVEVQTTRRDDEEVTITRTSDGELRSRRRFDETTQSWHPIEHPIKTREDLQSYRWVWTDVDVAPDFDAVEKARRAKDAIGERGLLIAGWGKSPWMHLIEFAAGPALTTLLECDYPELTREVLDLMHAGCKRIVQVAAEHSPVDVISSVENTSTTLLSPAQFEKFCRPLLMDYGRIIESAGKMHELHMCGQLSALLESIDGMAAASIEAFSSPPIGNTTLADGRAKAPAKTLVGGTCANTWLQPVEGIIRFLESALAECPDRQRIVLTTGGQAPQGCSAETFRAVGNWLAAQAYA